jgi:hypothetical protein
MPPKADIEQLIKELGEKLAGQIAEQSNQMGQLRTSLGDRITALEQPTQASGPSRDGGSARLSTGNALLDGGASHILPGLGQMAPLMVRTEPLIKIMPFTGTNQTNPVTFVQQLEQYFRAHAAPKEAQTAIAMGHMSGSALTWAEAFLDRTVEFSDFKRAFLDTYWGTSQQRAVRFEIYQGNFRKGSGKTMADHFAEMVVKAKYLRPRLTDQELIEAVTEHYIPSMANIILAAKLGTKEEMVQFLRKVDANEERKSQYQPQTQGAVSYRGNPWRESHDAQTSAGNWRNVDNRSYQGFGSRPSTAANRPDNRLPDRRQINAVQLEVDEPCEADGSEPRSEN